MKIIELNKEQFDMFAYTHRNHNFYQTSQYGTLMSRHGFKPMYIGLMDNNTLVAASLILKRRFFGYLKFGYAPRGYLIDFNDYKLVYIFTKLLRRYLYVRGFVYLKIDPNVINTLHDKEGNPLSGGINNKNIVNHLKRIGYMHYGFNKYFENVKARWNVVTKINSSSSKLFSMLNKETRNKIRTAERRGIVVYKGTKNDLKTFYKMVKRKHVRRQYNYYLDYYEIFSKKDMFDIYFAKLIPEIYLKNSKELYELELEKNNELQDKLVNQHIADNKSIINKKIESDKKLNTYRNDIVLANKLIKTHPEGLILATSSVIKYNKELSFLIDGYNMKYKHLSASHFLRWKIMEEHAKEGYIYIHQNGITGDFNKDNKYHGLYEYKMSFNGEIVEYIGEFDLVIYFNIYHLYKNTDILEKFIDRTLKKTKLFLGNTK